MRNTILIGLTCCLSTVAPAMAQGGGGGGASAAKWGYLGANGPAVWAQLDPANALCKDGEKQSPIDIRDDDVNGELDPPELSLEWEPFNPVWSYDGRVPQIDAGGDGGRALLGGAPYALDRVVFRQRSEHWIEGYQAPLEAQFVHVSQAGETLIVSVLIKAGEENDGISDLLDVIEETQSGEEDAVAEASTPEDDEYGFDPDDLTPEFVDGYRYRGSFSTPPCAEEVVWHVMGEPAEASAEQIRAFSSHFAINARPLQRVGERVILTDIEEE